MKRSTSEIGRLGEDIAEKSLKKRFWKILSRNFKARGGEIDIIAYRMGVLAFVEVKTRTNELYGRPRDAVDCEKVSSIRKAARQFCEMYHVKSYIELPNRFGNDKKYRILKKRLDVIEIFLSKDGRLEKINHIKDWEKQI